MVMADPWDLGHGKNTKDYLEINIEKKQFFKCVICVNEPCSKFHIPGKKKKPGILLPGHSGGVN